MRYVLTFFSCAALAVAGIVLWLAATLPHGEGAYGIAKVVPLILVFGSAIAFCIIWFPANLGAFLWSRRTQPNRPASAEAKFLVVFSGCVFFLCLAGLGTMWIRAHSPQKHGPPPPQRQIQLSDVKGVIDSFCAKERSGVKLTPADGIFATMQQLVYISPTDVVKYMADNLEDNSGFLWVIAGSPTCPPETMTRFLSIPPTHLFLARNSAATPQVLESLSHSTNGQVRQCVAANAHTPKATLEQLTHDPESAVRDAAAKALDAASPSLR